MVSCFCGDYKGSKFTFDLTLWGMENIVMCEKWNCVHEQAALFVTLCA